MEKRKYYLVNKAFNGFLLASLLTVAANQLGATVDGMMLSYLVDERAMSSVNICRPIMQLQFALSMWIGAGSSMMVGMAIGNRHRDEANRIFAVVMSMVVIVGVAFLLLGVNCLQPLVGLLCADDGLRGVTTEYLGVTLYGALFYMLSVVLEMFVAVDGNPKRVSLAVISCVLTNLVLDYVFIKFFSWGVRGAASATVLSYLVSVIVLLPHFLRKDTLKLACRSCFKFAGSVLSSGLPFGLATMLLAVQFWGNNTIAMSYLGEGGILALSVCIYLLGLSMIILTGTLKAFQPVASILKGADDVQGVLMVIRKSYRFMAICLAVFVLPLVLFPRGVAMIYGVTSQEWIEMVSQAIPPFTLNIIFQCVVYLLIPIYQLYDNKSMATFISVGQSLAPMLGMWLLAEVAPRYVWWGFALGQIVVALLIVLFAAMLRQRNRQLRPFILVPCNDDLEGFETSVSANIQAMGETLDQIDAYLKQHLCDASLIMHIEVSSEELLKNVITHGFSDANHVEAKISRHYIDYRLTILPSQVKVVISDDAKAFNPVEYDKQTGLGLLLVRGLCQEIKYDYLFRQNMTTVIYAIS